MGKVDEKKRVKREALLLSAYHLFTENGIQNTSISEIVNRAKLAKGTFYLYFKDKYDIRDKLVTHMSSKVFEEAGTALQEKEYPGLEEYLLALIDNILNQLSANHSLLRFIAKNLSWAVFSNIRISEMDNRECIEIFEEMIEKSGRNFRNIHLMIYMIVELVNSTCYNVILYEAPVTLEELKPELYGMIRGMMKQFELVNE